MLDVCAYYRIYILNLVKAAEQGPITFFYDCDVKFPAIPFTTIGKSFQALKFGFDLPIVTSKKKFLPGRREICRTRNA